MYAPNVRFDECCPLGFDLIPKEVFEKCILQFPMVRAEQLNALKLINFLEIYPQPANSAPRVGNCIFNSEFNNFL
jgi:hypothetical protein